MHRRGAGHPLTADGLQQRRARASIDVYALNCSGLVLARKQLVRQIRLRIARVARITRLLEHSDLAVPVALVLARAARRRPPGACTHAPRARTRCLPAD